MFSDATQVRSTNHRECTPRCDVPRSKRDRGFTLIELITTLVVASILAMIAVPSMRGLLLNGRIRTVTDELTDALNVARSEAIKSQKMIEVCISDDRQTCTGTDWSKGWVVYDSNPTAPAPTVIKSTTPLSSPSASLEQSITVTAPAGLTQIQFQSDGTEVNNSSVTGSLALSVCDDVRTGEKGRQIQIFPSGQVSVSDATCP